MKNKLASIILLSVSMLALALPAPAQLTNSNPLSRAGLEELFSLHNPTNHYYTQTNSFEIDQGAATDSRKSGIYQATKLSFFHRLSSDYEIGLDVEADSLGSTGNNINLIGGHLDLRYDWDNIAVRGFIGGFKDIDLEKFGAEAGIGLEYRISKNFGFFTHGSLGWQEKDAGSSKTAIFSRLIVGASFAIGN